MQKGRETDWRDGGKRFLKKDIDRNCYAVLLDYDTKTREAK